MTVDKIENGLERGSVKHYLNCLLITGPIATSQSACGNFDSYCKIPAGNSNFFVTMNTGLFSLLDSFAFGYPGD